jgi:hypothetical protein
VVRLRRTALGLGDEPNPLAPLNNASLNSEKASREES